MPRTVLLRHDLPHDHPHDHPAGSHHFDWLFEPADTPITPATPTSADPNARVLITFRLATPPHKALGATLAATRLPPHRRLYLDYEGPISGNRGRVQRVASGHADILADTPDRFAARVTLDTHSFFVEGTPTTPPAWQLTITPA